MIFPSNIITDVASSTTSVLNGSLPLLLLLFGTGITFYIIRNIIAMLPKG